MQETRYRSEGQEKVMQEFFEGLTPVDLSRKMEARRDELAQELDVLSSRQVELSARQMRKLRKAQRRAGKEKE